MNAEIGNIVIECCMDNDEIKRLDVFNLKVYSKDFKSFTYVDANSTVESLVILLREGIAAGGLNLRARRTETDGALLSDKFATEANDESSVRITKEEYETVIEKIPLKKLTRIILMILATSTSYGLSYTETKGLGHGTTDTFRISKFIITKESE